MPYQDHICRRRFMGCEPLAEVLAGHIDRLVRLVSGVNFGVNDMSLSKKILEKAVHMGREGAERRIVSHEAVNVNNEEFPFPDMPLALSGRRHQ